MRLEFDPIFLNEDCFTAFPIRQGTVRLAGRQSEVSLPQTGARGRREQSCEQRDASRSCQPVPHSALRPKRCQRLRAQGPWAPPLLHRQGQCLQQKPVGLTQDSILFNIMRENTAWPHIPWRLSNFLCPNFIADFGLSLAVNTTDGRTLCPIEISDTVPTVNESSASFQPLTCSCFQHYHCNSQHCHCTAFKNFP